MKKFERYFGNNVATVLYIVSGAMIAGGLIGIFFRLYGLWTLFAALILVGVVLFFITVRLKITDRDMDEVLSNTASKYKEEHIDRKVVDRKELNPDDYDVFSGYLFHRKGLKRKLGKDGKIRTSAYYVSAIQASRKEFGIFYSEYELLTDVKEHHFIHGKIGDRITLTRPDKNDTDSHDKPYTVRVESNGNVEELTFHTQDDALVDTKLKLIEELGSKAQPVEETTAAE